MGFNIETGVPALTVFFQGLLSFFSPCVLPLVPLYISYLAGGAKVTDKDGNISYPRKKVLVNTIFFVIGVSFTFFLLGFGFTALGMFFKNNRLLFARISGIIMILFGLYQFGLFGKSGKLSQEHRLPFRLDKWSMGPVPALLLGFTFSFAWTPCVGPTLGSVLLMAGSTGSAMQGLLLIAVYTLGFVLPFLAVGLFTGTVLDFFKKHQNVVRYSVKIGAALLVLMGVMTLTGFMNGITNYLSDFGNASGSQSQSGASQETTAVEPTQQETQKDIEKQPKDTETTKELVAAPDFTLVDQYGNEHKLSDYRGKTVFLNFWATWCSPCKAEMPQIQTLYENYGENEGDLIVLGMAAPNYGREGDIDTIKKFLTDKGYTFPVLMDEDAEFFYQYGISAFPTTFMIDKDGNLFGYIQAAITGEMMESIVQQTMTGVRE